MRPVQRPVAAPQSEHQRGPVACGEEIGAGEKIEQCGSRLDVGAGDRCGVGIALPRPLDLLGRGARLLGGLRHLRQLAQRLPTEVD